MHAALHLILRCKFIGRISNPTTLSSYFSTSIQSIVHPEGNHSYAVGRENDRPGSHSGSHPYQNQNSIKTLITTRSRIQGKGTWPSPDARFLGF